MIERYLESLEDEGVENPMAIYERAQELVAKFSRDG
jgi:hypothetical protein